MKDLNVYIGFGKRSEELEKQELLSFENGPIIGSYIINGILYGIESLRSSKERTKTLISINRGEESVSGEFSGLIDQKFLTLSRYEGADSKPEAFVQIEEEELENEDTMSLNLFVLHESKDSPYWARAEEAYLQELGYDVSIARGSALAKEMTDEEYYTLLGD